MDHNLEISFWQPSNWYGTPCNKIFLSLSTRMQPKGDSIDVSLANDNGARAVPMPLFPIKPAPLSLVEDFNCLSQTEKTVKECPPKPES